MSEYHLIWSAMTKPRHRRHLPQMWLSYPQKYRELARSLARQGASVESLFRVLKPLQDDKSACVELTEELMEICAFNPETLEAFVALTEYGPSRESVEALLAEFEEAAAMGSLARDAAALRLLVEVCKGERLVLEPGPHAELQRRWSAKTLRERVECALDAAEESVIESEAKRARV